MQFKLHTEDFANMEEFVNKYIQLIMRAWAKVFVAPVCPQMTEWNGACIVDPDGIGIPFSKIISMSGSALMPNVVNMLADACRRDRTRIARVYRLASTDHPIIDTVRDKYLLSSVSGKFQNQIDRMQRDANCDMTDDEIKGRESCLWYPLLPINLICLSPAIY